MTRDARGLLAWFVVGLVAGGLASSGALIGGVLFGSLLPGNGASWVGGIVATAVGAALLLVVVRGVTPRCRLGNPGARGPVA
jgi:uncharacterized membrane protein YeaQ/YmgE (transglycosylase-associated protein family)